LARYQNLMTMGAIANRSALAARFGSQYGGDRKIYQALGYPTDIEYEDYLSRYTRQDIAKAVINRPISQTWKGQVNITETDTKTETALEKEWKVLDKKLKLQSKFVRLDKVSSVGQYGILLLGFDDTEDTSDFAKPVEGNGKRKLLYVKPLGEGNAPIKSYVKDPKNERYGMPEMYEVTFANSDTDTTTTTFKLHWTRALHVTTELLESEVEGEPVLKPIWNRLMDLEKLTGGSAEMFWRGARPGYQGKIKEDFMMTTEMEEDLEDQMDEYENNLRRFLMNEGVEFDALETQVTDPSKHVDVQIQMISAITGIPKRILTGSERGELSSEQDLTGWYNVVQTRREEHAEPNIVRPFVDLMIKYKVLPAPKDAKGENDYQVEWSDLFATSDKDKAEIGKTRAEALKAYASNPSAEMIVPPEAFLEYFLGLDEDQREQITELMKSAMAEEERAIREAERLAPQQPTEEPVEEEEEEEVEQ